MRSPDTLYRGRIAPTPTGYLHAGHAATFAMAAERARKSAGTLILRIEDLDPLRCHEKYASAAIEDLEWLGISWQEGPNVGGPFAPYLQSQRRERYLAVWRQLRDGGYIYPCRRSRKDLSSVALAPHEEEPVFPTEWRTPCEEALSWESPEGINWRFRVPDGETLAFCDENLGEQRRVASEDFGDFLIWNRDGIPAYELAVVVDDVAMGITEVVRGADLLTSTARQLLLYRALQSSPPAFFHCPLITDEQGIRLAKRHASLTLRTLRELGRKPAEIFGGLSVGEAKAGLGEFRLPAAEERKSRG